MSTLEPTLPSMPKPSMPKPSMPQPTLLPQAKIPHRRSAGTNLTEAFRIAFMGLFSNKMRSFLTMLGIIIGVFSVIVMLAFGQGAAQATQDAIKKLGTNVLTVIPNSVMRGGVSQGLGSQQSLKLEDAESLKKLSSVRAVAPEVRQSGTVKYANANERTTIMGSTADYFEVRNLPIDKGRIFTTAEVKRRSKVAVIGDSVRDELFGPDVDSIGKTIKVNGQDFKVVGTTRKRGGMMFRNPDDQITIPITTAMQRVFGLQYIASISVQAASEGKMREAEEEVIRHIDQRHRVPSYEESHVRVFNQQDIQESAAAQSGVLTVLLTGIATVSLLVGGIGIMNIMLVSVTERTREIGIRKAIGAKRSDILYQFLIESVALSLVGGLLGVLLAIGTALWLGAPPDKGGMGLPMVLTPEPIVMSFVFSALVGIFFGIYPALKASRLDPIVALRYE